MKTELSEVEIVKFYKSAPLEQAADAILKTGMFAREARRWKRIAAASIVGCAALCLISIFLLFDRGNRQARMSTSPEAGQRDSNHTFAPGAIRLVAVVTHTDACPLCQQIGDITAGLRTQFKDHPVMFVKLDLSDDVERRQSEMLTELLDFELPDDYHGPSFFVLDSSGNVLEELEGISKQDLVATNLRGHLVRR